MRLNFNALIQRTAAIMLRSPRRGNTWMCRSLTVEKIDANAGEVSKKTSSCGWAAWIAVTNGVDMTTSPNAPSFIIRMFIFGVDYNVPANCDDDRDTRYYLTKEYKVFNDVGV